jgi:hypothetical protein
MRIGIFLILSSQLLCLVFTGYLEHRTSLEDDGL